MKKLAIIEDSFINMDAIIAWYVSSNSITLITPINVEDNGILFATEHPGPGSCYGQIYELPIQEIKRIQREVDSYMQGK